jgi:uncharacterized protein YabN with tetrapyrrole methylase and pyrophosphatase domain
MSRQYKSLLTPTLSDSESAFDKAIRLTHAASTVGFDWPDPRGVLDKVAEELNELTHELEQEADPAKLKAELGDLLFACCNVARHLKIDPAEALNLTSDKFIRRFHYVESQVHESGRGFSDHSLSELDAYWDKAKYEE